MKSYTRLFLSSFAVFLLIIVDHFSKFLSLKFGFAASCNSNLAFGARFFNLESIFVSLAVLVFILLLLIKSRELKYYGLLLIFGGGISNLVERFYRGCVVDFISFEFLPIQILRTSFNLADTFIFFGVVILIYVVVLRK